MGSLLSGFFAFLLDPSPYGVYSNDIRTRHGTWKGNVKGEREEKARGESVENKREQQKKTKETRKK